MPGQPTATVTVSILVHNRLDLARACLTSVLRSTRRDVEILVTDNGSAPATRRYLATVRDPRVRLLRYDANLGVIRAKNRALIAARAPLFVSLDSDCTVGPGWVRALEGPVLARGDVAQVGRRGAFARLTAKGVGVHPANGQPPDYIDGSCFLVRTDVARRYGLCDPAFDFAYCEDADFSLRLRKAGWGIALVQVPVHHSEHGTAGGMNLERYWRRNHALLLRRWGGYLRTRSFGHPGEPDVPPRLAGEEVLVL